MSHVTAYHRMTGTDRPCEACVTGLDLLQRTRRPHGHLTGYCPHHRVAMLVTFEHGEIVSQRAYLDVTESDFRDAVGGGAWTAMANTWATPTAEARPRDLA